MGATRFYDLCNVICYILSIQQLLRSDISHLQDWLSSFRLELHIHVTRVFELGRFVRNHSWIITPAWAEVPNALKPTSAHHDDVPTDMIGAAPFNRDCADVLSGTSVLKGSDLTRELRSTIGDTLAHLPRRICNIVRP